MPRRRGSFVIVLLTIMIVALTQINIIDKNNSSIDNITELENISDQIFDQPQTVSVIEESKNSDDSRNVRGISNIDLDSTIDFTDIWHHDGISGPIDSVHYFTMFGGEFVAINSQGYDGLFLVNFTGGEFGDLIWKRDRSNFTPSSKFLTNLSVNGENFLISGYTLYKINSPTNIVPFSTLQGSGNTFTGRIFDLTGDGKDDIIVNRGNSINVYDGSNNTFALLYSFSPGIYTPISLEITDINNDTKWELFTAHEDGNISLFEWSNNQFVYQRSFSFNSKFIYNAGVSAIDYNNRKAVIIIESGINAPASNVTRAAAALNLIYFETGQYQYSRIYEYSTTPSYPNLYAGGVKDIDSDGIDEIFSVDGNRISIFNLNATGVVLRNNDGFPGYGRNSVFSLTFTTSGFITGSLSRQLHSLQISGTLRTLSSSYFPLYSDWLTTVSSGDVNGDGVDEILFGTAGQRLSSQVGLIININGEFISYTYDTGEGGVYGLAVTNIDLDLEPEILALTRYNLYILNYSGDKLVLENKIGLNFQASRLQIIDLDRDGMSEIVIGSNNLAKVVFYKYNELSISLQQLFELTFISLSYPQVGSLRIIGGMMTVGISSGHLLVYNNLNTAGASLYANISVGGGVHDSVIDDLEGDGVLDLFVGKLDNTIAYYHVYQNGSYTERSVSFPTIPIGSLGYYMSDSLNIVNFDSDSYKEIIIGSTLYESTNLIDQFDTQSSVLYPYSSSNSQTTQLGTFGYFDNDAYLDYFVSHPYFNDQITILEASVISDRKYISVANDSSYSTGLLNYSLTVETDNVLNLYFEDSPGLFSKLNVGGVFASNKIFFSSLNVGLNFRMIILENSFGNKTYSVFINVDNISPIVVSNLEFDFKERDPIKTVELFINESSMYSYRIYNTNASNSIIVSGDNITVDLITLNVSSFEVGLYTFTLWLQDMFGNNGNYTIQISIKKSTAPLVIGNLDVLFVVGQPIPEVSWEISSKNPAGYNISLNGQLQASSSSWENGTLVFNLHATVVGYYSVLLVIWDTSFEITKDEVIVTIIDDIVAPLVEIPAVSPINPGDFTLEIIIGDINPGYISVTINQFIHISNALWTNGTYLIDFINLQIGQYEIEIVVVDSYENKINITLIIEVSDNTTSNGNNQSSTQTTSSNIVTSTFSDNITSSSEINDNPRIAFTPLNMNSLFLSFFFVILFSYRKNKLHN